MKWHLSNMGEGAKRFASNYAEVLQNTYERLQFIRLSFTKAFNNVSHASLIIIACILNVIF